MVETLHPLTAAELARRAMSGDDVTSPLAVLPDIAPDHLRRRVNVIEIDRPADLVAAALDGFRPAHLRERLRQEAVSRRRMTVQRRGVPVRPLGQMPLNYLWDTSYPWSCSGLVQACDGWTGSGSLVGSRLVLTASHVCPWEVIDAGQPWWMTFQPYAQPLRPTAPPVFPSSYVSDILTYRHEDKSPHGDFATAVDYSVLRLFDAIGSQAGFFGVTSFDGSWAGDGVWADVSYPAGAGPYYVQDVDISGDHSPGVFGGPGLDLNADLGMYPGCSGSGYWAWFDIGNAQQTPRITGVVSAISDDDTETYLGSGEELVNLVNQARGMWP